MLSQQNVHEPTGQITEGDTTADIVINDQINHAVDYKPLIVGYNKGAAVRLENVADVLDSTQNIRTAGYLNGTPAIMIIIFRQPGANIIDTVDGIRANLPSIQASIPQGIKTTIVLDRTTTIRASVSDVERTLLLSIALVILVVFIFLRKRSRHVHSRSRRAGLIDRDLRRHVPVRFQHRQSLSDGAHHLDRLCGRRRYRRHGEYLAPARGRACLP